MRASLNPATNVLKLLAVPRKTTSTIAQKAMAATSNRLLKPLLLATVKNVGSVPVLAYIEDGTGLAYMINRLGDTEPLRWVVDPCLLNLPDKSSAVSASTRRQMRRERALRAKPLVRCQLPGTTVVPVAH